MKITSKPVGHGYDYYILGGLQGKHVYGGTVDPAVVARRRKANKAARKQRKINAKNGARHGVR